MPGLAKEMNFQEHLLGLAGSWQGQPSAHPWAVCSQHCKAENCGSAQAQIFADCCHEGLGCLKHLRLPINGNQHCSNSTECWLLAAAENLSCKAACLIFLEKPKQIQVIKQVLLQSVWKNLIFYTHSPAFRAAPNIDLG